MRTTTSSTRSRRAVAPTLTLVTSLCGAGCYDGAGRGADDDDATADASSGGSDTTDGETSEASTGVDELPEREVGLDAPTVALEGPCFARSADERAASVSPEGDLWLARDDAAGTAVRSLAPDSDTEIAIALPWPIDAAQAWDRDRGTVLATGGLWSIEAGFAEPIRWPDDVSSPFATCGDPSRDGDSLVLAGDLFSRDVGQWWRWNIPGGDFSGAERLAASVGACSGPNGRAFLLRGEEVWTIESDWIAPRPELGPAQSLAADGDLGGAAIVDDALHVLHADDTAERVVFEAGPVHAVVASPGMFWVRAGDRLYRFADGDWAEIVDDAGAISDDVLGVDDQGVWLDRGDEVCHRGPASRIRISGLRPYEHRRSAELSVELTAASAPNVTLDGDAIDVVAIDDAFTIDVTLDEGWHTLVVEAGAARRTVAFAIEGIVAATWTADIEPLFTSYCSGVTCHGPDPSDAKRPDLSLYATWVESSDAILDRVVTTGDMPPAGSGDGSFGVDDVLLMVGWIEAGLPESEED